LLVSQVDLIGWSGTLDRGLGRAAPGLLAGRRSLRVARRELGLVLGPLALETFPSARFDCRARLGELCQTLLAPRQFLGDRQAVGQIRPVRRLGLGQQVGHFGLQLRLDPARMLV
jgi:hypothetical protein